MRARRHSLRPTDGEGRKPAGPLPAREVEVEPDRRCLPVGEMVRLLGKTGSAPAEQGIGGGSTVKSTEIEPSGGLVLECGRCGEELVLLGPEEDWRSEGRTSFGCGGCGEELALADRLPEHEPDDVLA